MTRRARSWLVLPAASSTAPTLRQHLGPTVDTAGTTVTITGITTQAGSCLILRIAHKVAATPAATISSIGDGVNPTANWTLRKAQDPAGDTVGVEIWAIDNALALSNATITITFNKATTDCIHVFDEYSGVSSASNDAPASAAASGTVSPWSATGGGLAQNVEVAVYVVVVKSTTTTVTPTSPGWTNDATKVGTNITAVFGAQVTSSNAALTSAGTLSVAKNWDEVIACMKGA